MNPAAPLDRWRLVLLGGAGLVLLAGEPLPASNPWFSAGYVLRAALLPLYAALVALLAAFAPAAGPVRRGWCWVALLLPGGIAIWSLAAPTSFDVDGMWRALAGWGALALLPVAWVAHGRERLSADALLGALLVAGALCAGLAIAGAVLGHPAVGPLGRVGVAGVVFAALLPLALCRLRQASGWRRLVVPALLTAALLLTHSRTAMAAACIGVLVVLARQAATPARRRGWRLLLAAAVALVLLGGAAVLGGQLQVPGSQQSVEVRRGLYRSAADLVAHAPLRGAGLGSYPAAYLRTRDAAEARLEAGRRAFHAHNDALHVAVEGGVPAFALLLAWWAAAGWMLLRGAGAGARGVGAGALGMLAALAVGGLGDGVLVDPAPVLLAAAAMYVALVGVAAQPGSLVPHRWRLMLLLGACALVYVGGVLARHAVADFALMRYVAARVRPPVRPDAEEWLSQVALSWRPAHPRALHLLGVERAQRGQWSLAREAFREALRADPALTEARLDLAQTYVVEDRSDDALAVLREGVHHDPRRYELFRRQAEVLAGPEPVPGDALPQLDEVAIRRTLNQAAERAGRPHLAFVDDAWFWRRTGHLELAGAALRQASGGVAGPDAAPPAEVFYEAFRLAEWEGRAPDLFVAAILMQALAANPAPALRLRAEAERFLDEGDRRMEAARAAVEEGAKRVDDASAQRAYAAAAVRLTALLHEGRSDAQEVLRRAREELANRQFRRALARFRSLLAWALPGAEEALTRGPEGLQVLARQADLLIEAAQVASRVDAELARLFFAQGHVRLGLELLERGQWDEARRRLEGVLADDPAMAEAAYALARGFARASQPGDAAHFLLHALQHKPALARPALREPDFASLRETDTRVRTALGLRGP